MESLDLRFSKSVLAKLHDGGPTLKTNLQAIVKNLYSLDKLLLALKEDGLVKIDTKPFGKNIQEVSLTPKGRAVAEQIRRISEVGQRKAMELPDSFKLITFLYDHGPRDVASIKEKFPGLFGFVEELTSSGIIVSRIDSSRHPPENVIDLTEKGKKIAEKIKLMKSLKLHLFSDW